MTGSAMKNLRMFRKLCGDDGLGSVVLATTFWSEAEERNGRRKERELQNEQELMNDYSFWGGMIQRGSCVFRHYRDMETAMKIVDYLVSKRRPVVLDIQRQMVDHGLPLDQTSAGLEVGAELAKQRELFEKELDQIKKDMADAIALKDEEMQKDLAEFKAEVKRDKKKEEESRRKLQVGWQELRSQRNDEFGPERRRFEQEMHRYNRDLQASRKELASLTREKNQLQQQMERHQQKPSEPARVSAPPQPLIYYFYVPPPVQVVNFVSVNVTNNYYYVNTNH